MTSERQPAGSRFRTFCVVGRVSNLPTVLSNCLAGWWLGQGRAGWGFAWLAGGALLLYLGGMFLNDAVDAEWDREHRPERPVPSGRINVRAVCLGAFILLFGGWLLLVGAGVRAAAWGLGLQATIVIYDLVHKRVGWAPILMAACRGLLYLTATASAGALTFAAWRGAVAMTLYVAGISFLARRESTGGRGPRWPILLLLAPPGLAWPGWLGASGWEPALLLGAGFCGWTGFWAVRARGIGGPGIGRSVSGLLAGIPLADALVAGHSWGLGGVFGLLFLAARAFQRWVPAT